MKNSAAAVHDGLIAFLRADAGVLALVGARVYDRAPQSVTFPYVALGRSRSDRFRMSGAGGDGATIYCEVHVWSRAATGGKYECEAITATVANALDDAALSASGHKVCGVWVEGTTVNRMGDGLTLNGIINLRIDTLRHI